MWVQNDLLMFILIILIERAAFCLNAFPLLFGSSLSVSLLSTCCCLSWWVCVHQTTLHHHSFVDQFVQLCVVCDLDTESFPIPDTTVTVGSALVLVLLPSVDHLMVIDNDMELLYLVQLIVHPDRLMKWFPFDFDSLSLIIDDHIIINITLLATFVLLVVLLVLVL